MKRTKQIEVAALRALRDRLEKSDSLRCQYRGAPLELLEKFGFVFPGGMRDLFMDIYFGKVDRAIGLAGRGNGKTCEAGALATTLFLLDEWNVGIVSGSKEQAMRVIEYVQDVTGDEEIRDLVADETKTLIKGKRGNWIKASPASTKAIRGLHAKGRKMLLILDEEAEMAPEIVRAALSVVVDAERSVILRISTMHMLEGTFVELVDNAPKLGYKLYKWDSFDVARGCERECARCLNDYAAEYKDAPGVLEKLAKEFHDRYCRERPKTNKIKGWIAVKELRQNFLEMPRNWFETEVMALRPSGEGKVLDYELVKALFETSELVKYVKGAPVVAGIDWGFKGQMALWLAQYVGKWLRLLEAQAWTETDISLLIEVLCDAKGKFGSIVCYPDSSHPFENNQLREAGFEVDEVVFGSYKETGAGFLKFAIDNGLIETCGRFPDAEKQLLGWSRGADGKIKKGNDHFCDALLCATKGRAVQMAQARIVRMLRSGEGFFRRVFESRRARV